MGALSSRQLAWAGGVLFALGALILSRGGTGKGLILCAVGAAMIGKRLFGA